MKKKSLVILTVVALAILVLVILMANSFNLALIGKGYSTRNTSLLVDGFSTSGNEYKVIQTTTKQESVALVYLEKEKLGNWKITSDNVANNGTAEIGWMKPAGTKNFNHDDDVTFEFEWHVLRYGNNALKSIDLSGIPMPLNTTVNVNQTGEFYLLHFITFGEPVTLPLSDTYEELISQGFISSL